VYILEVKDIDLPVCKIGMTTRTPQVRCNEINNSSTGDFIWKVAHFVAVDNCVSLESLVHKKLLPLRQKGREFFNINADDAHRALLSIVNNQTEIQLIEIDEVKPNDETAPMQRPSIHKKKRQFTSVDSQYAELLETFSAQLEVKGRPFGQLNRPLFGISDGHIGIQWNLAVNTESGLIRLGVNLEGTAKTGDWLIASFILAQPDVKKVAEIVEQPQNIIIRLSRDAWQAGSRVDIKEELIGGKEYSLDEITHQQWDAMLEEAKGCLDESKNYRGMKQKQAVTRRSDSRTVFKNVSPHLTIWTQVSLVTDIAEELRCKFALLKPVYDWVTEMADK